MCVFQERKLNDSLTQGNGICLLYTSCRTGGGEGHAGFMKMAVQGFQGPQNETALAGRHLSGQKGKLLQDVYKRQVAVAAFDFSMVSKKVSCTVSAPTTEKISRLMASL